jgi:hypothetical protein
MVSWKMANPTTQQRSNTAMAMREKTIKAAVPPRAAENMVIQEFTKVLLLLTTPPRVEHYIEG